MIQDGKRNVLRSLVSIFRKERPDIAEAMEPSALESRARLQERIESALEDTVTPIELALEDTVEPLELAVEDTVKPPEDHFEAA